MFWGKLASVNLYGCDHSLLQSKDGIRKYLVGLCKVIKMKRMGEPIIKKFGEGNLEGYSAMQFIETSSVTLHLDDKMGDRAFIDIFSCKDFSAKEAEKFSKDFFKAKKSKMKVFIRK